MNRPIFRAAVLSLTALVAATGCATTRARKADPQATAAQVESLQAELAAKDQQIQDLQYQLESYQQSYQSSSGASSRVSTRSSVIRVKGVTAKAVQRALSDAGYDPGPIDGRIGKKTKAAIKEFQRRNNLKADGIVGERTWSLLKP